MEEWIRDICYAIPNKPVLPPTNTNPPGLTPLIEDNNTIKCIELEEVTLSFITAQVLFLYCSLYLMKCVIFFLRNLFINVHVN